MKFGWGTCDPYHRDGVRGGSVLFRWEKDDLLRTAPGVGEQLSLTLLAYLTELGTLDRRQIAALGPLPALGKSCTSRQLAKRAVGDSEPIPAIIRLEGRQQRLQPRTLCWESGDGLQGKAETR